jgi:hypothetical protein
MVSENTCFESELTERDQGFLVLKPPGKDDQENNDAQYDIAVIINQDFFVSIQVLYLYQYHFYFAGLFLIASENG